MEVIDSKKLVAELSFVAMDLETTGSNYEFDQIIEIGLVKVEHLEITDELHYLVNPGVSIPPFVQKLTAISPEDLVDCPRIEEVMDELLSFIGESIVVAHNISFDLPFFNSVLQRLGRNSLTNHSLCTNLMGRYLIPGILSSNLGYMGQLFNIPHCHAHRALEDARACAHLLLKFLQVFIRKGICKVNQLYYPQSRFELDRADFLVDQAGELLTAVGQINLSAVVTLKGANGVQLAVLPLEKSSAQRAVVRSLLECVDYQVATVQLMGSFFEAFLQCNLHYRKFSEEVREFIRSYLEAKYAPEGEGQGAALDACRPGQPGGSSAGRDLAEIDPGHFLLARHLIPGQFFIYPLFNLSDKNALICHFPGHKKRITHYAKGQLKRQRRKGRHFIHRDLLPLVRKYLLQVQGAASKDYMLLPKDLVRHQQKKFYQSLQWFVRNDRRASSSGKSYPQRHI